MTHGVWYPWHSNTTCSTALDAAFAAIIDHVLCMLPCIGDSKRSGVDLRASLTFPYWYLWDSVTVQGAPHLASGLRLVSVCKLLANQSGTSFVPTRRPCESIEYRLPMFMTTYHQNKNTGHHTRHARQCTTEHKYNARCNSNG